MITISAWAGLLILCGIGVLQWVFALWIRTRLEKSVQHEYDKEIEKHKTQLAAVFEREKKLYDGKLLQYKKYNRDIFEVSIKMKEYLRKDLKEAILGAGKLDGEKKTQQIKSGIGALITALEDNFYKIKLELQSLKLESGPTLLKVVKQFETALQLDFDNSIKIFRKLISEIEEIIKKPDLLVTRFEAEIDQRAEFKVLELHDMVFHEMRRELGLDK